MPVYIEEDTTIRIQYASIRDYCLRAKVRNLPRDGRIQNERE